MITGSSSSEQSPLHNESESQWSQASSGLWVPKTPRPAQHQPSPLDYQGWKRYWAEHGWPWRREPEITHVRQKELAQRRAIPVNKNSGIYPFGGMTLTRADIEWLLATHEGGQGPVNWSDVSQQARWGLDLRGAVVSEKTDLSMLPLARLRGGLSFGEIAGWLPKEPRACDLICLKHVDLGAVHLEGARLRGAYLEGADLSDAHLEGADLDSAHLEGADLREVHLEGADLREVHLEGANLWGAYLKEPNLWGAHLEGAILRAHLEGADLQEAHLEGADLQEAHLGGANLSRASLASVNLTGVTLANATGVGPSLVDVNWGETNLSVVDWSHVQTLGDEFYARQPVGTDPWGEPWKKTRADRREDYQEAHRANHQLAVVLQSQGLVDDAARFAYHAKCSKRTVFWYDLLLAQTMRKRFHMIWPLLFSWVLFLLAGYGYRLRRCLSWYIGIVLAFTLLYWWLDPVQFPWWVALGESVNVFHGRGAAPTIAQLAHPVWFTLFTVVEALIGLLIEVVFVATMIQRLFGK